MQDLLDDSARTFHKAVAIFQREQAEAYHQKMGRVWAWLAQEVKKPTANVRQAHEAVSTYDWNMRVAMHADREQFEEEMLAVKETRDALILAFCRSRGE